MVQYLKLICIINKILKTTKIILKSMPHNQSQTQCQKLFEHLNYCIQILKKNLDHQKIEIIKRVQHDIQLLKKYLKSLLKYNDKRQTEFQKVIKQLKNKQSLISSQDSQILQLSLQISKKQQEITQKSIIIQHLKYSKKIDASYASSILFNQNSLSTLKDIQSKSQNRQSPSQSSNGQGLNLSRYSQHCAQQKVTTQDTLAMSRSDINQNTIHKFNYPCGIISQEEQSNEQKGFSSYRQNVSSFKQSSQSHKASNLIFGQ